MDAFVQAATNQSYMAAASELGLSAGRVTRQMARGEDRCFAPAVKTLDDCYSALTRLRGN
jgi:hypothetical protein